MAQLVETGKNCTRWISLILQAWRRDMVKSEKFKSCFRIRKRRATAKLCCSSLTICHLQRCQRKSVSFVLFAFFLNIFPVQLQNFFLIYISLSDTSSRCQQIEHYQPLLVSQVQDSSTQRVHNHFYTSFLDVSCITLYIEKCCQRHYFTYAIHITVEEIEPFILIKIILGRYFTWPWCYFATASCACVFMCVHVVCMTGVSQVLSTALKVCYTNPSDPPIVSHSNELQVLQHTWPLVCSFSF